MGGCGSALKVPNEKRFRRAIKLYQVTEVKSLTNLINRNKCFESGESPLTLAAQEGHEAVVHSLVVSGADVNRLDNHGKGPLHIAVQLNDEETVEILLKAKANPNKYDNGNATPLHLACESGNVKLVRKLLIAGANVNENQKGVSPLIFAVAHGNADCAEELLKHGADPNIFDSRNNTALHLAVRNKDAACTKHLLDHNADPHIEGHDTTSLMCLACLTGCAENVKLLHELGGLHPDEHREEEPAPVIAAAVVGDADCLDILLSCGANPDVADKRGQTALEIAVFSVVDLTKESFYGKYFSNLYRQYSKYDIDAISQENSTRCAMSLVTGGASVAKTWNKFGILFPNPSGINFEQMVTCEVLIQCFGFRSISTQTLRTFVCKLLELREHGLLKLLYSAGVDPTWNDESLIGISVDENDRELYRWIKRLRTNPRSLKDLCRKSIRAMLSGNVLFLIRKVPTLPEELKEYVCIMDTEHYSVQVEEGQPGNNNHGGKEEGGEESSVPEGEGQGPVEIEEITDDKEPEIKTTIC